MALLVTAGVIVGVVALPLAIAFALEQGAAILNDVWGLQHDPDMARVAADPTSRRWWTFTDPCQERLPGTPEGQMWRELPEIWHLD